MFNPIKYAKNIKLKLEEMETFEVKSPVRSLIPSSLVINNNHIISPNKFYRIYHICDFPSMVHTQQMLTLLQSNLQFTISVFTKKIPNDIIKKGLKSARSGLLANLSMKENAGSVDTVELANQAQILLEAEQKLSLNLTSYFDTSIFIRIESDSLEELKTNDLQLKATVNNMGYGLRVGGFDQKEHLLSTLPIARNNAFSGIRLDTEVLNNIQTTITRDRFSVTAPFLGFNLIDRSAIFKSPNDEDSPHVSVLGSTGSGKTFTAMLQSLRQLYTGEQQIFIDVEKQFSHYVRALGFTVLEVSEKKGFNLYFIPNYEKIEDQEQLQRIESSHAQAIVGAMQIIIEESANICNIGILSQIMGLYYKEIKYKDRSLDHFLDVFLKKIKANETFDNENINSIFNGLKPFGTGGIYGGLLTGKGGYDFEDGMVCIDCSSVTFKSKSLKVPIMFLIFQMFTNLIDTDRTRKRRIILDEVHLYFQNPKIGQFLIEFAKMARKRNAGGTFLTQESVGMTAENGGLTLMSQSGTHIILFCPKQTITDLENKGFFEFDEETKRKIRNFEKGQCLYLTKKDKLYLEVHAFKEELDLIKNALEFEN